MPTARQHEACQGRKLILPCQVGFVWSLCVLLWWQWTSTEVHTDDL